MLYHGETIIIIPTFLNTINFHTPHRRKVTMLFLFPILTNMSLTLALVSNSNDRSSCSTRPFERQPLRNFSSSKWTSSTIHTAVPPRSFLSYHTLLQSSRGTHHDHNCIHPFSVANPQGVVTNSQKQARSASVLLSTSSSSMLFSSTQPSLAPTSSPNTSMNKAIVASIIFILLDVQLRSIFRAYSIQFPSSLAGCGALFATLIGLTTIDEQIGERLFQFLNPGAILLAKWLPVFFVPSLITLPLASGLENYVEGMKVLSVIVGGFLFTLFTTAWSVLGIRKLTKSKTSREEDSTTTSTALSTATTQPLVKPFGTTLFRTLKSFAWISAVGTVVQIKRSPSSLLTNFFQSSFLFFITLSSFVFGANLPASFTKVVHPLVTCTSLTWLAIKVLSLLTGSTFVSILRLFKRGTLSPIYYAGAGDILIFLLGPAVIALACQMYDRKKLVRENLWEVAASTTIASIGGLYGTAVAVRQLGIVNPTVRLSLLSRNITSPLAMAIASMLGADTSLGVTIVVLTGLIGANFGAIILDAVGIKDPVARGLGIGAAAHGLGTAAFSNEKDAFPFAAISMALIASACTVLISLSWVKKSVLKLALDTVL